ncbi:MAG: hypothetical protein JW765_08245 [Deltaproteobacteria bacterium]|nr:hypothetical protein [Candidatus Zymogenaceae bacterium]
MEEYTEIYFSYNTFETDVVSDILTREGIPFIVRDQRMTPYPLTIDHFPEQRVAVPASEAVRAVTALRYARDTGALPGDGTFVDYDN